MPTTTHLVKGLKSLYFILKSNPWDYFRIYKAFDGIGFCYIIKLIKI